MKKHDDSTNGSKRALVGGALVMAAAAGLPLIIRKLDGTFLDMAVQNGGGNALPIMDATDTLLVELNTYRRGNP